MKIPALLNQREEKDRKGKIIKRTLAKSYSVISKWQLNRYSEGSGIALRICQTGKQMNTLGGEKRSCSLVAALTL